MARKPTPAPASAAPTSAAAAASFADGHIEPAAPVTPGAAAIAADPLEAVREAERVLMVEEPVGTPAALAAATPAVVPDTFGPGALSGVGGAAQGFGGDLTRSLTPAEFDEALEEALGVQTTPPGSILIVSTQPGFRRAGITHPNRAEYPLDYFTGEQLALLRAEPKLQVIEINGTAIPRTGPAYGTAAREALAVDPLQAGQAAADAVSRAPNRTGPGLRNAAAGAGAIPVRA